MFRSVSNTDQHPAVQPEIDAYYGIWYAYIWGSNVDFGAINNHDLATIEIDYGIGITPKWKDITFNIAGLYYTYPGYCESACGLVNPDYFELKTAASWTGGAWTLGIGNWWSPNTFGQLDDSNATEGSIAYAFSNKWFNFFSPSLSGLVGYQWEKILPSYTYWNAGLTLGFMDHWSVDVRYYDTDLSTADCLAFSGFKNNCDARAVGTLKAVF